MFAERCSSAILDGLLDKMCDLGVPTISCLIGTQKFDQALCDLRASMRVMPKVIYNQLDHDYLVPTFMHLQLADQSIRCLVGIVEDILVRIRNCGSSRTFVQTQASKSIMPQCHTCRAIVRQNAQMA
jgi:hypothetical protein